MKFWVVTGTLLESVHLLRRTRVCLGLLPCRPRLGLLPCRVRFGLLPRRVHLCHRPRLRGRPRICLRQREVNNPDWHRWQHARWGPRVPTSASARDWATRTSAAAAAAAVQARGNLSPTHRQQQFPSAALLGPHSMFPQAEPDKGGFTCSGRCGLQVGGRYRLLLRRCCRHRPRCRHALGLRRGGGLGLHSLGLGAGPLSIGLVGLQLVDGLLGLQLLDLQLLLQCNLRQRGSDRPRR